MIIIVDYGMGNLHSVKRAFEFVAPNSQIKISSNPLDIKNASKLILPGQGAMADCMKSLNNSNLKENLLEAINHKKTPTLGICVGMQMLFENSEEGNTLGLGILQGQIKKFHIENFLSKECNKIPHMGWNNIQYDENKRHNIFNNIANNSYFYFIHSYYLPINNVTDKYMIAKCKYGLEFVAAIAYSNIIATQFHPEKSSDVGLELYKNFANT